MSSKIWSASTMVLTVIFISTATNSHRLIAAHSAPTQKLNLKSAVPQ